MRHSHSNVSKEIGKTIAKNRHKAGLTQAQVAEIIGISTDAVSRMERGAIMPTVARLIHLAEIFNCQTADLLTHSSHLVHDHSQRVLHLLNRLDETDRIKLIEIIEHMVDWHT